MRRDDDLGEAIETADGSWTIKHPEHGECYHSAAGALQEARDLYVVASGFEAAIGGPALTAARRLHVLDIGLGLGYNAAATIAAWYKAPTPPEVVVASLECDAALFEHLRQGKGSWQKSWPEEWRAWMQALQGGDGVWQAEVTHPQHHSRLYWRVYLGDASQGLPPELGEQRWDFFWQDPFSPTKNPPLWSAAWFSELGRLSAAGGTLMTYSVARPVREALSVAGWQVEKIPTSGHKRAWLRGQWRS